MELPWEPQANSPEYVLERIESTDYPRASIHDTCVLVADWKYLFDLRVGNDSHSPARTTYSLNPQHELDEAQTNHHNPYEHSEATSTADSSLPVRPPFNAASQDFALHNHALSSTAALTIPTPTYTSATFLQDTLRCNTCSSNFSGKYRSGNLARHMRQKHAAPNRLNGVRQQESRFWTDMDEIEQNARLKHHGAYMSPDRPPAYNATKSNHIWQSGGRPGGVVPREYHNTKSTSDLHRALQERHFSGDVGTDRRLVHIPSFLDRKKVLERQDWGAQVLDSHRESLSTPRGYRRHLSLYLYLPFISLGQQACSMGLRNYERCQGSSIEICGPATADFPLDRLWAPINIWLANKHHSPLMSLALDHWQSPSTELFIVLAFSFSASAVLQYQLCRHDLYQPASVVAGIAVGTLVLAGSLGSADKSHKLASTMSFCLSVAMMCSFCAHGVSRALFSPRIVQTQIEPEKGLFSAGKHWVSR